MHPTSTKHQFIELRSQGLSLSRIAGQIGVSKRTLIDWNREHQAEIESLRAAELEALHEGLLASHEQELTRLASFQRQIDEELASRSLKPLSTEKLLRLSFQVRREIRTLCTVAATVPVAVEPGGPPGGKNAADAKNGTCANGECRDGKGSVPKLQPPELTLPSSPIKLDQADPNSSAPVHSGAPQPAASIEHPSSEVLLTRKDPESSTCNLQPETKVPSPHPVEHCLHCGGPLPPLLPDGTRPSPWCACGSPINAPPGLSIRELCPYCSAPVPVHGYNTKRWSGTCPKCQQILPPLDESAPLKWLPPNSEWQLHARI